VEVPATTVGSWLVINGVVMPVVERSMEGVETVVVVIWSMVDVATIVVVNWSI